MEDAHKIISSAFFIEEFSSHMKKENDVLEETLSIAENGYAAAYHFLLGEYEKNPEHYESTVIFRM